MQYVVSIVIAVFVVFIGFFAIQGSLKTDDYLSLTKEDIGYINIDCPKAVDVSDERRIIGYLLEFDNLVNIGESGNPFLSLPVRINLETNSRRKYRIEFSTRKSAPNVIMSVYDGGFSMGSYNGDKIYKYLYRKCYGLTGYERHLDSAKSIED